MIILVCSYTEAYQISKTYISPGIWSRLEGMIRSWARKYGVIHVITGTIFDVDEDGIKDKEILNKR